MPDAPEGRARDVERHPSRSTRAVRAWFAAALALVAFMVAPRGAVAAKAPEPPPGPNAPGAANPPPAPPANTPPANTPPANTPPAPPANASPPNAQGATPSDDSEPAPPGEPPLVEAPAKAAPLPEPQRAGAAPSNDAADGSSEANHEEGADSALKYVLDDIVVRGNTKTHARVILRYLPFRAGDTIDVDDPKVSLARFRLLGTGFFRDVEFALRKGKRRGHVVLIIEVEERNTLIVNDLWMGLAADANTAGHSRPLTAYAGIDAAETNLAGTGITLGAAVGVAANDQFALRMRFFDPAFLGSSFMTAGSLLYDRAADYFGSGQVYFNDPNDRNYEDVAVLQYRRFGGTLGVGRDLSVSTQLWASYRLERIDAAVPRAAQTDSNGRTEPIDFQIERGESVLSTLGATLQHDTRDKPFLTTRGWFASVSTEVSLVPFGSDYAYSRLDLLASKWWSLPWNHVLKLRAFGGAISGNAPFFEQYVVGDLSDFRAPRVLGLGVERRPAPNFFGTVIGQVRHGDYAAKVDVEYRIPLYRGVRSVYGIDLFARAGLYLLASDREITSPPPGYSGAALVPIDFTANLGVQMDTSAGGFTFALANAFGFIPALSEGR